jgi:predicted nucleic acid-binding protein
MNLFFDSSALLKRYLDEKGSDRIEELFHRATLVFVSSITQVECASTFRRLFHVRDMDKKVYQQVTAEASLDFPFFQIVDLDAQVKEICLQLLIKYPLKSLDTIQLASLIHASTEIESFVVSDQQLKKYALKEGIHVIDPIQ